MSTLSTFWLEDDNEIAINPSRWSTAKTYGKPGWVVITMSDGMMWVISPFSPQYRQDEAFISGLTESTTLNEALLELGVL